MFFKKTVSKILSLKNSKLYIISVVLPFIFSLKNVALGSIPFWFDPARHLLLALENLEKPMLIGQPSGMPGVFYGPYYIWLLSVGVFISKDPRVITFITMTLPYFIIFPVVLFLFKRIFTKTIITLLWLLFIFKYSSYATAIWNPNLVPLLFLVFTYVLVFKISQEKEKFNITMIAILGIMAGLIFNLSMSFGLSVILSSYLFLFIDYFSIISFKKEHIGKNVVKLFSSMLVFSTGIFLTFIPFILFEFRHGFKQTQAVVSIVTDSVFYNSAAVGGTGFSPSLIINYFFGRLAEVLNIPGVLTNVLNLFLVILIVRSIRSGRLKFDYYETRLLLFLTVVSSTILYIFLSSKNPVWNYYFIGTEIIFLLLLGLIAKKFKVLYFILLFWVILLSAHNFLLFFQSFTKDPLTFSTFASKKYIVDLIKNDNQKTESSVYAFSPALYTYDYDYLFKMVNPNENLSVQTVVPSPSVYTYLIIPETTEALKQNFINYNTPNKDYFTVKTWTTKDKTYIVKRQKK
ncbi:MAG: hypothetical protein AAB931_00160 [Patescibacteria group bacterium]